MRTRGGGFDVSGYGSGPGYLPPGHQPSPSSGTWSSPSSRGRSFPCSSTSCRPAPRDWRLPRLGRRVWPAQFNRPRVRPRPIPPSTPAPPRRAAARPLRESPPAGEPAWFIDLDLGRESSCDRTLGLAIVNGRSVSHSATFDARYRCELVGIVPDGQHRQRRGVAGRERRVRSTEIEVFTSSTSLDADSNWIRQAILTAPKSKLQDFSVPLPPNTHKIRFVLNTVSTDATVVIADPQVS